MKILLADDDQSLRRVMQFKLEQAGHAVTVVENGRIALGRLADDDWDLLISDIRMPNVDGIELLGLAKRTSPELKVILITAHATISQAVQALKLGAFDYITKPFEDEELIAAIDRAGAFQKLERENRRLRTKLKQTEGSVQLLGVSRPFKAMMTVIEKIAATDATVLLTGPSGAGKELVARAIHNKSPRAEGDFVALNCGAIPAQLIESELFGHVKGSFTGAIRDKKGKFELASGGTILLDEVSELAVELQVKLLRVLQERVIEPVGAEKTTPIDVRVIGATNVDLMARVAAGKFREDLFYRLNVIPVVIPTLAERRDDIPLLINAFIRRRDATGAVTASRDLVARLQDHSWPGNVRELENLIERMTILRQGDVLTTDDLPDDFSANPIVSRSAPAEHLTFHEAEAKIVRDALETCGWNRTRAAHYLKIPRHVLLYRMKKHQITEDAAPERPPREDSSP